MVKVYLVDVRLQATAYVEAKSAAEALQKVRDQFHENDLYLDHGSLVLADGPFDQKEVSDPKLSSAVTSYVDDDTEAWTEDGF